MKGWWITAAAAGMMAQGAHAQSSVTLYGVVTASVQYVNNSQNVSGGVLAPGSGSRTMLNSSGIAQSRFGLRGTEELGGGTQALFVLENQFNTDDGRMGQNAIFGRQAFVGLKNDKLGRITFGRQYTSSFLALGSFTPVAYAPEFEPVVGMAGPNFRENNMVQYHGKFGPLSLHTHWSFGERAGSLAAGSAYGIGVSYYTNGFGVAAAYDEVKTLNAAQAAGASSSGDYGRDMRAFLAGSYEVGAFKFVAGYRWGNSVAPGDGTPTLLPHRDDMYWAGVHWQTTPALRLSLAWYYDDVKRADIGGASVNPANPQQYLALADYRLTKRTDLFAGMMYARNASLNWDNIGYLPNGQSVGYAPATSQVYYKRPDAKGQLGISLGIRTIF
ncbi:outer membrane protein (porin) [Cupriavidus gilardii CR3]|uniref:Porin n=1 Tax=Cupriavidus gilardii TaxID=82541 RepID=A0A849BDE1_9BURK|nr:porin [Cupriavidus gilardii]ALD93218.1 outer membrane protein (porin) [Cupriavidus gilardii CR3]KAB0599374.1 porin [Cupriavidus gilardii]MCT9013143.1 porin [Cupriavidus gilardii]MCT9052697.1 porin [Cupriavidus gilardii]NNH13462.1 porin [Cupriavidus gilardii]